MAAPVAYTDAQIAAWEKVLNQYDLVHPRASLCGYQLDNGKEEVLQKVIDMAETRILSLNEEILGDQRGSVLKGVAPGDTTKAQATLVELRAFVARRKPELKIELLPRTTPCQKATLAVAGAALAVSGYILGGMRK